MTRLISKGLSTLKTTALLFLFAVLPSFAATHYVSASGVDTNNGTSKTTAWLHAPGMGNCASNCASYTPVAGDQIILRGGDTWHFGASGSAPYVGAAAWGFSWSGSSGNPIYIGVDQTWFTGSSWSRPIMNGDNPLNTMPGVQNSQVSSCAHPGSLAIQLASSWVTLDNFEFTGHCWNTNSFGNNIMVSVIGQSSPNGVIVEHCYVHGWTNTVAGQAEGGTWVQSYSGEPGMSLLYNIVDGSDSDPATLNYQVGDLYVMAYNVIRYNQGQNSTNQCHSIHDNLFEFMFNVADGSGAHSDVLQCYGETGNGSGDPNLFYNNIFRHIAVMSNSGIWFFPPSGQTDYMFNTVSYDDGVGGPDNFMLNQTGGPGGGNLTVFNSTFQGASVFRNDLGGGTLTSINNQYVSTPATAANVFATPGSVPETTDVFMTDATAATQGYANGNDYAPTLGTNSTVGAGTNRVSFCNSLSDTVAKASCLSGTTNGCVYVTASHTVSCPDLVAVARPTSGAWDAAAYQFSSGTPSCTVTSPTTAMIQLAQTLQFTATIANAPSAYKIEWFVDYSRWRTGLASKDFWLAGDYADEWVGIPFAVNWYTGLNGDGVHTVSGVLRDVFGAKIADCAAVTFTVRVEGQGTQTLNAVPTSGTGKLGMLHNGNSWGAHFMIDGYDGGASNTTTNPLYAACGWNGGTSQVDGGGAHIGSQIPSLVTTCWPNGQHLLVVGTNPGSASGGADDPIVVSSTFTSTNVVGSTITCVSTTGPCLHQFQNSGPLPSNVSVAIFSTTGTLPTPLVAGTQWLWRTSTSFTSNTVTVAISGGVATFTTSPASNVTSGTPVYLLNIKSTDQVTGLSNCDGYYNGSGTVAIDSTHFSVVVPAACNGATGGIATQDNNNQSAFEVDINPYFLKYVDANTISVSATPGGPTLTLTSTGGTGNTIQSRMRSPYWTNSGANGQAYVDWVSTGAFSNIFQLVTFANSSVPMQLSPPSWEYHGYAGKSGDTACPTVWNTDYPTTQTLNTISCGSPVTYTPTDDGVITGAITVSSTGVITYNNTSMWSDPTAQSAWAKILVACATCGPGSTPLPSVTVYVENHGNTSASVTNPHHTTCGIVVTSFTTGNCHSFFPISAWQAIISNNPPAWLGPMLTRANFNSVLDGISASTNLTDATKTSCTTWPDSTMTSIANFANTWDLKMEYDMYPIWYNLGNNTVSLAAILNNTGYDRGGCLQSLVSYLVNLGRIWRLTNDDEVTDYLGKFLETDLSLTGGNFVSMTTSGGVATFTVSNVSTTVGSSGNFGASAVWVQSTGIGTPLLLYGLTNHSACNGVYLPTTVNSTTWTAPTPSGCSDGLTINSSTDSGGYLSMSPSNLFYDPIFNGGNVGSINTSALPWNLSATFQQFSTTTFLTVSGSVATVHSPGIGTMAPNHSCSGCNPAIRIWGGVTAHLNIVSGTTWLDADDVTITYPGTTGGLAPTCTGTSSQCNGTTDPQAYITVDPMWGPNPMRQFYNLVNGVSNVPVTSWSILGASDLITQFAFEGNKLNTGSSWLYVAQGPAPFLTTDASVNQMAKYSDAATGIGSRAYDLKPRSMLTGDGYVGGGNTIQNCRSFSFNPGCDRPGQLSWRRETTVAQIIGMKVDDIVGIRLYNFLQDMTDAYSKLCCGWHSNGGWGTGGGMNLFTQREIWSATAHTNALLKMREDTELQPEGNKPYLGPYFKTDVHVSSVYGNELTVLCASEMPYGNVTVALNPISGGTTLLYTTNGYTTRVSVVAGNPSSVTKEFCPSPGFTSVYVSQPPGYTALDNITFQKPAHTLPYSASKFLIQYGYFPDDMESDPVVDCTASCTIGIDHHNINAWYRVIYADSNSVPLVIGAPSEIVSQGLY